MFAAKTIDTKHKDLVHDVSYDFYGRRFATGSTDCEVKVWDQDEEENWYCSSEWKAHQGPVWKVTWAHPEFGQVIATASFDRSVVIWEEKVVEYGHRMKSTWIRRAGLVDSRSSVQDVKFAPKHLGLLIATISSDGTLRIYEAPDIMNLSQWNPIHDICTNLSCTSLDWNPSPFHPPMIVVGSDDDGTNAYNVESGYNSEATTSKVIIFEAAETSRRWFKVDVIPFITGTVQDVSFAPNIGRDDHVLAIANGTDVKIVSIKPVSQLSSSSWMDGSDGQQFTSPTGLPSPGPKYKYKLLAHFTEHASKVWKVEWNIMGTILGSSSEDGTIKLWKSNYLDNWTSVGTIRSEDRSQLPPGHSQLVTSRGSRV